ncbi:MAG: phosphate uptake regulator [halophilic archaeon J07HX64]|jgi:phosphate uptake regulator, PhoU|nr:MAG: phosphate uptake regulator [halophilic archaeon J07HX64]
MARETYEARLALLRDDVVEMAGTALERYRTALDVLETGDRAQARRIIEGDDDINRRYLDIESDCIELLALQQPVAGDLRFIASSFKIVTDIERVGDLATNMARYGQEAGGGLDSQHRSDRPPVRWSRRRCRRTPMTTPRPRERPPRVTTRSTSGVGRQPNR